MRSTLPAMSRKRRSQMAERRRVVADVVARDGGCILREVFPDALDGECGGPVDGHEVLPKGRGGDWLDRDNVIALCRAHHGYVHAHPAWAETVGLLKPSGVQA